MHVELQTVFPMLVWSLQETPNAGCLNRCHGVIMTPNFNPRARHPNATNNYALLLAMQTLANAPSHRETVQNNLIIQNGT